MDPVERLDGLIAADPAAEAWSFAEHERGALHEAERLMTFVPPCPGPARIDPHSTRRGPQT